MLDSMTLAALLTSRVCHDLISPVSALTTGLEVLEEDPDEDMRRHALDLVRTSAAQASAKLQFVRLAFGAAGGLGAELDLDEARILAEPFFAFVKPDLDWRAANRTVDKDVCKIALNLCLLAIDAIPRGGVVDVSGAPDEALVIAGAGPKARLTDTVRASLDGAAETYDAKSVLPYYVGRLVSGLGAELALDVSEDRVAFHLTL